MPMFDYKCRCCNKVEEHLVKSHEVKVVNCSHCEGEAYQMIGIPGVFKFYGEGFYKMDRETELKKRFKEREAAGGPPVPKQLE